MSEINRIVDVGGTYRVMPAERYTYGWCDWRETWPVESVRREMRTRRWLWMLTIALGIIFCVTLRLALRGNFVTGGGF